MNNKNMVDERFELLSLVFRLAGRSEYGDEDTDYQKEIKNNFSPFKSHPAIEYASKLPVHYDAIASYSCHIVKDGDKFVLLSDIDSLDKRWTTEAAMKFIELLNDFYTQSQFANFIENHKSFYEAETKRFIEETYGAVDLEWFRPYVDPTNLRCIYSPSSIRQNYGVTVNGKIVYSVVSGSGGAIVHEFCHSFANPIGHKWYDENADFKRWCHDSYSKEKMPSYSPGKILAGEYVTRAYNILYDVEHGKPLFLLLLAEKDMGWIYIEDVYAMITTHEKMNLKGKDLIKYAVGGDYEMGEEQTITFNNGNKLRWRVLSLSNPLPYDYPQTEVGNVLYDKCKPGDVLYVDDSFLLVTLPGEATFRGQSGFRKFSRIPLYTL
jgi:hypothetical protein